MNTNSIFLKTMFSVLVVFGVMFVASSAFAQSAEMHQLGAVTNSNMTNASFVEVSGNYAYVSTQSPTPGVVVFDISDPQNPTYETTITHASLDGPRAKRIVGNYLFVATGNTSVGGLAIFDISNPSAPTFVSEVDELDSLHLTNAFDVDVEGNYAFVATRTGLSGVGAVVVVDINNIASPIVTGEISTFTICGNCGYLNTPYAIEVEGNVGYLALRGGNLRLLISIDFSNPSTPSSYSVMDDYVASGGNNNAQALVIDGNYAYIPRESVQAGGNRVHIIDLSNPYNLVKVGETPTSPYGSQNVSIAIQDDYLIVGNFVGSSTAGALDIFDISNPISPVLIERFYENNLSQLRDIAVDRDYIYAVGQFSDALSVNAYGIPPSGSNTATSSPVSSNRFAVLSRAKQQVARVRGENTTPCTSVAGNCLIAQMQTYLISQGHGVGMPIDGIMGPKTQAALESFKIAQNS